MEIRHFVQCRTLQRQVSGMGALLCHRPPCQGQAVLTFVAVAHRVEVDIVLVAAEEEEAEPGVEGIDGHDEEDADDVALLLGDGVILQVHVDLQSAQCRAVATTTREGNQRCPQPGGMPEACPMSPLLPGVAAPLDFHHRPIAMNRHMRQAPSQAPGQSLPQKHMEIWSVPRGCARSIPSSTPAPMESCPSVQRCQLAPGLLSAAQIPCSRHRHAHRPYVSGQPVMCTPKAQTPGCQMRNPAGCCLRVVPMSYSLSWLWQPSPERVGKVHPPELPRYPLQAATGGNMHPELSDLQ